MNAVGIFTFGDRLGLSFVVLVACASECAILVFLVSAANIVAKSRRRRRAEERERRFLETTADYYVLALLGFDGIEAAGEIMSVRWVQRAAVTAGPFCSGQGALRQIGNIGSALATLAIGTHTFYVFVAPRRVSESSRVPIYVLVGIAVIAILFTVIPSQLLPDFWAPKGYWCWISTRYRGAQLGLVYILFWVTASVNLLLFSAIYFLFRGNLEISYAPGSFGGWGQGPLRVSWKWNRKAGTTEGMAIARRLIAYPCIYILLILPLSITRWIQFVHQDRSIPSEALNVSLVPYASSGLVNVLVYISTHRRYFFGANGPTGREAPMEMPQVSPEPTLPSSKNSHVYSDAEFDQVPPEELI